MSDYRIIGPREDGYIAYEEGYYMGIMDKEHNVIISTEKHYRSIDVFMNGVAIVFYYDHKLEEGGWGMIDIQGNVVCECKYWYIKLLAGSLYLVQVTPGGKENLMWSDGKMVFKESYGSLYGYRNGYIIACNTIRKTKTTPTRYLKGLLHVRGEVLLPVEYDKIEWMKDYDDYLYIAREGHFGYVKALYGEHAGIEYDVELPDLWQGVEGTVCEGCIYTRGIQPGGKGCGRLFTRSFRDRSLKGHCEYRKTKLNEPSQAERKAIERWKLYLKLEDPFKEPRQLVKDFIEEILDGEINRLVDYDFRQLEGMKRYGDTHGYSYGIYQTDLVCAICTIIFNDIASKEVMFDKKYGNLILRPSPVIQEKMWGTQVGDWFFMLSRIPYGDKAPWVERIKPCADLCKTIGNIYLQPSYLSGYRNCNVFGRFLIDHMLNDLQNALVANKGSKAIMSTISGSKKFFEPYFGQQGWDLLMKRWLFDEVLMDYYGNPEPFTEDFSLCDQTPPKVYFKALDQCINLCHELIPNRSKRMVKQLKEKLH